MNKIEKFLNESANDIKEDLSNIVRELKSDLRNNPEEFTEPGCDEPSIDIRLGIDEFDQGPMFFAIHIGLPDYDQRHYRYCAASYVTLHEKTDSLFERLKDEIIEQSYY